MNARRKRQLRGLQEYPAIHAERVRRFLETRREVQALGGNGTKVALDELTNEIANRIRHESVRQFELDELESGTAVALYNVVWIIASDILHDIGVKQIKTSTRDPK